MPATLSAIAALLLQAAPSEALPADIVSQLPQGYQLLTSAHTVFGMPVHDIYIVALGHPDYTAAEKDQRRPLLIYELRSGAYVLVARNDSVVISADEAGQCDLFENGIATKGAWFTVQNSAACGQHWTDYITFRYDSRLGYIFDNRRSESWAFNPSDHPDAEALVSNGMHVTRAVKGHPVRFADWRDPDN